MERGRPFGLWLCAQHFEKTDHRRFIQTALTGHDRSFIESQIDACQGRWLEAHGEDPMLSQAAARGQVIGWVCVAFVGTAGWPLAVQPPSMSVMAHWLNIDAVQDIMKFQVLQANATHSRSEEWVALNI